MPISTVSPDTAVWASHYNQLVNAINAGAIAKYGTLTDLAAVDMTGTAYKTFASVLLTGLYLYDPASTLDADGYLVVAATGGGRWILFCDLGDLSFAWLSPMIIETLPPVQSTLNFASISANSAGTPLTVTVDGAMPYDAVQLGPPPGINLGLDWCGVVTAENTVQIRIFNFTGSAIDPDPETWTVIVSKPNTIPALNRRAVYLYERLLGYEFDDTTLETELGDSVSATAFSLLCTWVAGRRRLLADSTIKTAIQGSNIANGIMEGFEGTGY